MLKARSKLQKVAPPWQGLEQNKLEGPFLPNHSVILFYRRQQDPLTFNQISPAHVFMPLLYCLSFNQKQHKVHFAVLKGFSQFVPWGLMCSMGTLGYAMFALHFAQEFHRCCQKGIGNEHCGFLYHPSCTSYSHKSPRPLHRVTPNHPLPEHSLSVECRASISTTSSP